MAKVEKYYLRASDEAPWQRVTKEAWIKAERAAGFRPKLPSTDPAYATTCATGGFGGSGVQGKIVYEEEDVPVTSARNVGELRRLIEGLDDSVPLVRPARDHEYSTARAEVTTAMKFNDFLWEDHGEEFTPETSTDKRVPVLLVT